MPLHKNKNQKENTAAMTAPAGAPAPVGAGLENKFPQDRRSLVTTLAHEFWEKRGRPQNDDLTDWLAAEARIEEFGSV